MFIGASRKPSQLHGVRPVGQVGGEEVKETHAFRSCSCVFFFFFCSCLCTELLPGRDIKAI